MKRKGAAHLPRKKEARRTHYVLPPFSHFYSIWEYLCSMHRAKTLTSLPDVHKLARYYGITLLIRRISLQRLTHQLLGVLDELFSSVHNDQTCVTLKASYVGYHLKTSSLMCHALLQESFRMHLG